MKLILLLGPFIVSWVASAESFRTRVHSQEGNLVKFENGRTAFIDHRSFLLTPGELVQVTLDHNYSLIWVKKIYSSLPKKLDHLSLRKITEERPNFEATLVPDMNEALEIFNRSNSDYKRNSECSDRAHVWAHEEFKYSGTKSLKAFVFFTASYINSVRFKWWFHVAPLYKVNHMGDVQDMVMDFRYSHGPQTVKEWTDQFVYTKRSCKVTTKFSEYDVNPQTENCYLIYESMHYKIPGEIHEQELSGRYKEKTSVPELNAAYRAAFGQ